MDKLNKTNVCADLEIDYSNLPELAQMFELQKKLQDNLAARGKGLNYDTATFEDKVNQMTVEWRNITLEFAELLERLPFKAWKTYSQSEKAGFITKEQELETLFEYIDMFHFFLNIGLCLGIDGETFKALYLAKNKENFERQKRGY